MRNGLYHVDFKTQRDFGAGVVHAIDGKLWGGDAGLYYVGNYTVAGDKLSASVRTDRHTKIPGLTSVFGIDRVNIRLEGTIRGDNVSCKGAAAEAPGISFEANLARVSD